MIPIESIPRVHLAHLPTPLDTCVRLLGTDGPRVLIKRDDMTGLALGGNKARKLEFLLGAAKAADATAVMTTAGSASNYLRMTAAGARKVGLRPILFMRGTPPDQLQGNLLINEIVGADFHFIDVTDPWSPEARELMEEAARQYECRGERVYVITVQTTHAPLAAIGYVQAARELHHQLAGTADSVTHLFTPTGSGVTQAGLILGSRLLNWPVKIVGIAGMKGSAPAHQERIAEIVEQAAQLLGTTCRVRQDEVIVEDQYGVDAYGDITPGTLNAIVTAGEREGIILDPVYSGKAMHGLLDWHARGALADSGTVIFLHTGGAPNVFVGGDRLGLALRDIHQERGDRVSYR